VAEEPLGFDEIDPAVLPAGDEPCRSPLYVEITHVWDGDTVTAHPIGGGGDQVIRMIGVDTPEIDHGEGAECWGDEAWAYTREQLDGVRVWLTFDAECIDYYDRTLAYVHTSAEPDGMYNLRLAREGQATQLTFRPNDTFAEEIGEAEEQARMLALGYWGACP
jgi:endonuclease YncB( thermonuclease family)